MLQNVLKINIRKQRSSQAKERPLEYELSGQVNLEIFIPDDVQHPL